MLDVDSLREQLHYCPETGVFTWKKSFGSRKAGDVAGGTMTHGYARIKVGQRSIYAHRLAWMYAYGSLPECEIDHVNGNKADNSLANLRLASRSENQRNRSSRTGRKGVTWNSVMQKWVARCQVDGKRTHIGYFDDQHAALAAYRNTAKQLHGAFYREV